MIADLGYAFRQVRFARACVGRLNTLGADDALSRALDALERIQEAIEEAESRHAEGCLCEQCDPRNRPMECVTPTLYRLD